MPAVALLAAFTLAHNTGVSGYSGSTPGITCDSCHAGGPMPTVAPTVALTGPATLATASTATYTLTLHGVAGRVAGLDVSQTGGGTLIAGTGSQVMMNEVTHVSPMPFSAGSAAFSFTVSAPATAGTITLFAAGLSANGDDMESGDGTAATTLMIAVAGATAPQPSEPSTTLHAPQALGEGGLVDGGCNSSGALPQLCVLACVALASHRGRGLRARP
jgi:hypothetical protein